MRSRLHVVYHVADVRGAGDDVAPANCVALSAGSAERSFTR